MTVERFIKGKTYKSKYGETYTIDWEGSIEPGCQYVGTTTGAALCLVMNAWMEVEPETIRYFVVYPLSSQQQGYAHLTQEDARKHLGWGWKSIVEANVTEGTCKVIAVNGLEDPQ